jgi:hypothetical protein
MKTWKHISLPVLIVLFLTNFKIVVLNAQEISKADMEKRAASNFENSRYDKAVADYETLHSMFPKDTRYAYFLGRSLLQSNIDVTRAAELLKFVAMRNYGDDAYFYLGMAYLHSYQFDDALLAFTTFRKTATNRQLENYDADYWVEVSSDALRSSNVAKVLYVENLQVVPSNALASAFKDDIGGTYIYVPEDFKSSRDKEIDYQSLMYIPKSAVNGDYLYFSTCMKKGDQGPDIYRVRRLTPENFSLPEALPSAINTPYDEAYPFYDKLTATLYFSSKGHSTSGGFDIFKSQYDSVNATWKEPEKLDFPINSPYDDYLYTLTADRQDAIFLTNRNCGMYEAGAYTIMTNVQGKFISPANRDELLTCALLIPSSIDIKSEMDAEMAERESVKDTPASVEITNQKPSSANEYAGLIKEALDYQSMSDSLSWKAKEMRSKAENESDYRTKQELIANSTTLDQESKRLQRMAEEKFLLAENARDSNENKTNNTSASILKPEPVAEGITRYTYQPESQTVAEKVTRNDDYQLGFEAAKAANAELAFTFSINTASPYSAQNPIPVAMLSEGLVYRIQLGAFSNAIPEDSFGGLAPVSKEKNAKETKYYVGYFSSVTKAREALDKVKKYGYPDAFIVSFFDSKKISIQQAREIEFAEKPK